MKVSKKRRSPLDAWELHRKRTPVVSPLWREREQWRLVGLELVVQPTVAGRVAAVDGDGDCAPVDENLTARVVQHELAAPRKESSGLGLGWRHGCGSGQKHGCGRDDGDRLFELLEQTTQAFHDSSPSRVSGDEWLADDGVLAFSFPRGMGYWKVILVR